MILFCCTTEDLLKSPPKALPARASQKLVEKPTMSKDKRVPDIPINMTDLRPI